MLILDLIIILTPRRGVIASWQTQRMNKKNLKKNIATLNVDRSEKTGLQEGWAMLEMRSGITQPWADGNENVLIVLPVDQIKSKGLCNEIIKRPCTYFAWA